FWKRTALGWLYILCLVVVLAYLAYSQYQQRSRFVVKQRQSTATWQVAKTAAELETLLTQIPHPHTVVIDVDVAWCVAFQPMEQRVVKSATVQQALAPYVLIKLDLSQYDAAHQSLFNQWEILGPPTYLFLDGQQQEIRGLRLTGAFNEAELLAQLKRLAQFH